MDEARVTQFLTALGDPIRLQILFVIRGNRLNVGEIAQQFTLSRPAISHHLGVLYHAGIVQRKKEGQEVFYWVDHHLLVGELRKLADQLQEDIAP